MLCSCAKSNLNELPDVSSDTGLYIEIDDCLALEAGVNQIMSDLIQMDFYSQTVTKGDPNESEIGNLMHNVCGVMNPYAYTFIDRCGISIADINEIFDVNYTDIAAAEAEVVAFSLFMYALGAEFALATKGDSFRDCFMETTGIAAGIALIGGAGAATLGKEVVKSLTKKVLAKVSTRFLGGVGLVLMAGDMIYCMANE